MSTFCVAFCLLASSALAADTERVLFEGDGGPAAWETVDSGILPIDTAVGVRITGDAASAHRVLHEAESTVGWEGDLFVQRLASLESGGLLNVSSEAELAVTLTVDALGLQVEVPIWTGELSWEGSGAFDALSLGETVTVQVGSEAPVTLDGEVELAEGAWLAWGGTLRPRTLATLRGDSVETAGHAIEDLGEAIPLPAPTAADGVLALDSRWSGEVTTAISLDGTLWVSLCVEGAGCYEVGPVSIGTSESETVVTSLASTVDAAHEVPVAELPSTFDLGVVPVGRRLTVEVPVGNSGRTALRGTAKVEGEGFGVEQDALFVAAGRTGTVQVHFDAPAAGEFEGTLVLTTNDPSMPEIAVPLAGVAAEITETTVMMTTSGCTSVPGAPSLAGLLVGLLAVGRRRR